MHNGLNNSNNDIKKIRERTISSDYICLYKPLRENNENWLKCIFSRSVLVQWWQWQLLRQVVRQLVGQQVNYSVS